MANTLTALAPVIYSAARIVPRELTGVLGAVQTNFDSKGVALNDSVKIAIVPSMSSASVTPSQAFTVGSDRTITAKTLMLSNFKEVSWHYTAEEELSLMNGGTMQDTLKQTVEQGIRTLTNAIELYTWQVAYQNASRAFGTAGTTPFASTIGDLASTRKILVDNGAPLNDASLVMDTTAGVNIRSLANLYKVNEAGDSGLLRMGEMGRIYNAALRESGQIGVVTKGTGTGYLVNNGAGYAIGSTSITVDTGSGTIIAGDVITFAGDTNKYIVATALASNVVVIQEPGLKAAAADNTAITVGNNATKSVLLDRNSVVAVVRPALQPDGAIAEQLTITDPQTGLSFLLLRVPGNALTSWYMRIVYDAFAPNPYAIAQLLG